MTALDEARSVWKRLTVPERQTLIEEMAHDSVEVAPGIFRTPGVCGGDACVRGLRLPVWLLEEGRRNGLSDIDLQKAHPALTRDDFANAWAYVGAHRQEIAELIQANEEI